MRARVALTILTGLLLSPGCGGTTQHGVVDGHFSLPGRPSADLQRGGLNFSTGGHGNGNGHTTLVNSDGTYSVTLPPGSYSVVGGLSGRAGGPTAETCAETINVVVTADGTTQADFVCHASPVTP